MGAKPSQITTLIESNSSQQGVARLSTLFSRNRAISVYVQIMRAFMQMHAMLVDNTLLYQRMDQVEKRQEITYEKLEQVFKAIEDKNNQLQKGMFFDGQVFLAYVFISKLFKQAKNNIILIENYIVEFVFTLLTKRSKACTATIYTKNISKKRRAYAQSHRRHLSIHIILLGRV